MILFKGVLKALFINIIMRKSPYKILRDSTIQQSYYWSRILLNWNQSRGKSEHACASVGNGDAMDRAYSTYCTVNHDLSWLKPLSRSSFRQTRILTRKLNLQRVDQSSWFPMIRTQHQGIVTMAKNHMVCSTMKVCIIYRFGFMSTRDIFKICW
jgi:hypothetical protein